jgi:hypothetical protein
MPDYAPHFFGDFRLDLCGDFVTVKNGGSHGIHGNNYLNHKKCKGTPGGRNGSDSKIVI